MKLRARDIPRRALLEIAMRNLVLGLALASAMGSYTQAENYYVAIIEVKRPDGAEKVASRVLSSQDYCEETLEKAILTVLSSLPAGSHADGKCLDTGYDAPDQNSLIDKSIP